MLPPLQQRIPVVEASQVGEARRAAAKLAQLSGFDEQASGRLAIVVSELATNLVRHAVDGELLLQRLPLESRAVVEVVAIDKGPGISNIDRCLADGFSTHGTPGNGLGAVRRLSSLFEIYSQSGRGTVVVSRLSMQPPADGELDFGVVCLAYPGELVAGDSWCIATSGRSLAILVVDGLGHGFEAAQAAAMAIEAFDENPQASPSDTVSRAHRRMSSTRGGAIAVARHDGGTTLRYGAVGNISGSLVGTGKARGLMSSNGTVGAQIRQLRELEYECPAGTVIVLHSDGLSTRWSYEAYPGLSEQHPAVQAAVLYRDHVRGRDDVTVFVARLAA